MCMPKNIQVSTLAVPSIKLVHVPGVCKHMVHMVANCSLLVLLFLAPGSGIHLFYSFHKQPWQLYLCKFQEIRNIWVSPAVVVIDLIASLMRHNCSVLCLEIVQIHLSARHCYNLQPRSYNRYTFFLVSLSDSHVVPASLFNNCNL